MELILINAHAQKRDGQLDNSYVYYVHVPATGGHVPASSDLFRINYNFVHSFHLSCNISQ